MTEKDTSKPKNSLLNAKQGCNRVVILGSGYAGIHACRTLLQESDAADDLDIILLSDVDHMLYVTMIYEVPAGNLAPSSVRQSVRTMIDGKSVTFRQGVAEAVDTNNQTVTYRPKDIDPESEGESSEHILDYDYLVSAIGSKTEFFGIPGAEEHSQKLKKLRHAKQLKNTLINNFERANLKKDEQKINQLLNFVVVGGGPTGVTLAAKIANLLNDELARAFPELIDNARVSILEANDRVVKQAGPWFSSNVTKSLGQIPRLEVKTNCRVEEVQSDAVIYDGGNTLDCDCVVWAAGVRARELSFENEERINIDNQTRRIHVTPRLHLPSEDNVYVAGDQAWVERIDSKQPYPMRAQFAVRQGKQAAANILATIRGEPRENFRWNDKGLVISVGHGRTFADIFGIKVSGFFATLAYKSVYLMSTIGFRAKARAVLEWFMNIFLPRDISEL